MAFRLGEQIGFSGLTGNLAKWSPSDTNFLPGPGHARRAGPVERAEWERSAGFEASCPGHPRAVGVLDRKLRGRWRIWGVFGEGEEVRTGIIVRAHGRGTQDGKRYFFCLSVSPISALCKGWVVLFFLYNFDKTSLFFSELFPKANYNDLTALNAVGTVFLCFIFICAPDHTRMRTALGCTSSS